jgi:hypothetical protein
MTSVPPCGLRVPKLLGPARRLFFSRVSDKMHQVKAGIQALLNISLNGFFNHGGDHRPDFFVGLGAGPSS